MGKKTGRNGAVCECVCNMYVFLPLSFLKSANNL